MWALLKQRRIGSTPKAYVIRCRQSVSKILQSDGGRSNTTRLPVGFVFAERSRYSKLSRSGCKAIAAFLGGLTAASAGCARKAGRTRCCITRIYANLFDDEEGETHPHLVPRPQGQRRLSHTFRGFAPCLQPYHCERIFQPASSDDWPSGRGITIKAGGYCRWRQSWKG